MPTDRKEQPTPPQTDAEVAAILAQVSSEPGQVATGPFVAISEYFAGRRDSAIASARTYLNRESGFEHNVASLVLVLAECQQAQPARARAWADSMSVDDPYHSVLQLVCEGLIAEIEYEFVRAAEFLGRAMDECSELGLVSMRAPLGSIRAVQLFRAGRWTEAIIDLDNARTTGGDDAFRLQLNSLQCTIQHLRGNTAEAEEAWHRAQMALAAGHTFGRTVFTRALAEFYSDSDDSRTAALVQHWNAQARNGERIQALLIGPDIARALRDTGDPSCADVMDDIRRWAIEVPGSALDDVERWCRAIVDADGDTLRKLAHRWECGGANWLACQAWTDASMADRSVGDHDGATECSERAAVLASAIGVASSARGQSDGSASPQGDMASVISRLAPRPQRELTGPWAALGAYFSGDTARGEAIAREHLQAEHPFHQNVAAFVMVLVACQSYDIEAAQAAADRLNPHDRHVELVRAACAGVIAELQQDFVAADRHFGHAMQLSTANGITPLVPVFGSVRATQRFRLGEWDGALADLTMSSEHPHGDALRLQIEALRCMIHHRLGHADEAAEAWRRAHLALMAGHTFGRTWFTLALMEFGTDDAGVAATAALEHWTEQVRRDERIHALSLGPTIARLVRDRAQPSATNAIDLVLEWSTRTTSEHLWFVTSWCHAIVHADPVQLEEIACRLESDRTLWLAYQAWMDARSAHAAHGNDAEAEAATVALTRIARRIGIVEANDTPSPCDRLTPAEKRVAALVGEGMRNDDIASQLFLSRRTVESHLTAVFRKLSVSNRTELARMWLSTRQNP